MEKAEYYKRRGQEGKLPERGKNMPQHRKKAGRGRICAALGAVIPQKVSNRTVLRAMEVLRRFSRVPKRVIARNYEENLRLLSDGSIFDPAVLIENQACWESVQFGCGKHHNMKYSGCEIIATYNALLALGQEGSAALMAALISGYERDGSLRRGEFGVSVGAVFDRFLKNGYVVRMTAKTEWEEIEKLGRQSDALIVTAYNDQKNIMAQIHTVCVTKEKAGGYAVHNAYCWDGMRYVVKKGEGRAYQNLREAIGAIHAGAAPIAVLGICSGPQTLEPCIHLPFL